MADSNSFATTKLLLVDDDPLQLRIYKHVLLREYGVDLDIASFTDPAEALATIRQGCVDILVTDFSMPGISGLHLLRELKDLNRSAQVIMMTATSTSGLLLDALEMGADDYLLKPVDHAALIDIVHQAEKRLHRWRTALAGTLASTRGG